MQKSISIIGCGWLGFPLGKYFVNKGYKVKGSTTSKNKIQFMQNAGIEPHLLILNPRINCDSIDKLLGSRILIINIPPIRGKENLLKFHTTQISSLLSEAEKSSIEKILFISSTSVYGDNNKEVNEETKLQPSRESGEALVAAEKLISENTKFKSTIIRFGGLIGRDRNPGKFFAGMANIPNGDAPVNLIHLDDCIGIIDKIIEIDSWYETFNACSPIHPTRKELYTKAIKSMGLPSPKFESGKSSFKIVSPKKLIKKLDYQFKYPDPLQMF